MLSENQTILIQLLHSLGITKEEIMDILSTLKTEENIEKMIQLLIERYYKTDIKPDEQDIMKMLIMTVCTKKKQTQKK